MGEVWFFLKVRAHHGTEASIEEPDRPKRRPRYEHPGSRWGEIYEGEVQEQPQVLRLVPVRRDSLRRTSYFLLGLGWGRGGDALRVRCHTPTARAIAPSPYAST